MKDKYFKTNVNFVVFVDFQMYLKLESFSQFQQLRAMTVLLQTAVKIMLQNGK